MAQDKMVGKALLAEAVMENNHEMAKLIVLKYELSKEDIDDVFENTL